jgi:hypothetical protein
MKIKRERIIPMKAMRSKERAVGSRNQKSVGR